MLMWIFDNQTHEFLEVNEAALKHYGYTRDEFLAMNAKDIRPAEDVELFVEDVSNNDGIVNHAGEWRHKKKNGESILVEIISHPINLDGRNARHVIATDITDRKKKELQLIESENRFRTIVESAPDPIFIQIQNRFAYVNSRALALLKAEDLSVLANQDILSIIHPDFHKAIIEKFTRIFEGTESLRESMELKILALDGTKLWVEMSSQPIQYDGSNALIVFVRDITHRKVTAEAFNYQEYLLKVMGKIAKIGGWEFDPITGEGTWTEEVARIHELDPLDETSKALGLSFYSEDSKIKVTRAIEEAVNTQIPYDLELEMILKNGTHKWVHTFGQPVIIDGKVVKIRGAFQDITQRKIDERILKENEEKYRAFFKNSMDAILLTDANGIILEVNNAACNLFGYTESELKDQGLKGIMNKSDKELNAFITLRAQYGYAKEELQFIKKNGKTIYTELSSTIFKDAFNKDKASIIIHDITARKEAQQALLESEERYRLLLELAPVGIAVLIDHKINYINPAGTRLLGASNSEHLRYKSMDEFVTFNGSFNPIDECLKNKKQKLPLEWHLKRLDDKSIVTEVMITPLSYQGVTACQMIFLDITERIETKNEIMQLNLQLEKRIEERTVQLLSANKDLESFAYSVSHDLKAPLRGINGLTQLLQDRYAPNFDEEGIRLCERITANSLKMSKLIEDILLFSKANTSEIRKTKVDMYKVVNRVLKDMDLKDTLKKVDFKIDSLPSIKGDAILIEQVWINLISNAIKFSSKKENPVIEISCEKEADNYTFVIKDNGAGFNMNYANKLFDVFQRLHSEQEFQGTGAGLAIVQRIILKHGGTIWAEGEEDKGATFYFTIPV